MMQDINAEILSNGRSQFTNLYYEISIARNYTVRSISSNNEISNINGGGDVTKFNYFQRDYSRPNQTVEDIENKLERATERRNTILQELKERNENIVSKAMALSKQKLQKIHRASAELKTRLEINLALKESRRQQIIKEKVGIAKLKSLPNKYSTISVSDRSPQEIKTIQTMEIKKFGLSATVTKTQDIVSECDLEKRDESYTIKILNVPSPSLESCLCPSLEDGSFDKSFYHSFQSESNAVIHRPLLVKQAFNQAQV